MYLFGYGSLINITSAQKSFKRKLKQEDLIPVSIKGYEKIWNSIEYIQFADKIKINGVFLNLEKNNLKKTNGILIKITDEELKTLKIREKNYSCISIKANDVEGYSLDEDVIAFMTTKKDRIATNASENCFIASKYIDILTNSFNVYSNDFVLEYKKSLSTFPFPLKTGTYSFCDPLQHKIAREGIQ